MTIIDGAPGRTELDALEQAARGVRDGTLVYDYPTFQLLIAAVREADALREERDRLREALDIGLAWLGRANADEGDAATYGQMCAAAYVESIAALSPTEPAEDAK